MKRPVWFILAGLLLSSLVLSGCSGGGDKVRIATDATWPPFEFVNEQTKEIEGFDIDLMKAIAEEADLDIEFVNVAWDPLLAGMANCQYDAAISCPLADKVGGSWCRQQAILADDQSADAVCSGHRSDSLYRFAVIVAAVSAYYENRALIQIERIENGLHKANSILFTLT